MTYTPDTTLDVLLLAFGAQHPEMDDEALGLAFQDHVFKDHPEVLWEALKYWVTGNPFSVVLERWCAQNPLMIELIRERPERSRGDLLVAVGNVLKRIGEQLDSGRKVREVFSEDQLRAVFEAEFAGRSH